MTQIEIAARNIRRALDDYERHTELKYILHRATDSFVNRLAEDSVKAKQELRDLFSKSEHWHPELDAIVLKGTRSHKPDPMRVDKILSELILRSDAYNDAPYSRANLIDASLGVFSNSFKHYDESLHIGALKELAPKAYAEGKKKSRIFRDFCIALGIYDETKGSQFQKLYAQLSDEWAERDEEFTLFISINPAHFLTMSNPKEDERGETLTSCHSFNDDEYKYVNGCSGYARDKTTFIVFTVDDPSDLETLNNRKTSRQIFAYIPRSGLLMQSRMYNTFGGVYGVAEASTLYRDLVTSEISKLENADNNWEVLTGPSEVKKYVHKAEEFGGYPDWMYTDFDPHICLRSDYTGEVMDVGAAGLCIECGAECSEGHFCRTHGGVQCACCDGWFNESDMTIVYDEDGNTLEVCDCCRDDEFTWCDECGRWVPDGHIRHIDGRPVCLDCLCNSDKYVECHRCFRWVKREDTQTYYDRGGNSYDICRRCATRPTLVECNACGAYSIQNRNNTCPYCGHILREVIEDAV